MKGLKIFDEIQKIFSLGNVKDDLTNKANWILSGASVAGESHLKKDIPCQDHFEIVNHNDKIISVVCDGAGSAKYAQKGANLFSKYISEELKNIPFNEPIESLEKSLFNALVVAREKAVYELYKTGNDKKDFATTLCAFVLFPDHYGIIHIGDGAVVAEFDEELKVISSPKNGSYANETFFITENHWYRNIRIITKNNSLLTGIALMTDGMTPALVNSKKNESAAAVKMIFNGFRDKQCDTEKLKQLLKSKEFGSRSSDDKTLVILVKNKIANNNGRNVNA